MVMALQADVAAGDDVTRRLNGAGIRAAVLGLDVSRQLKIALHHDVTGDEDAALLDRRNVVSGRQHDPDIANSGIADDRAVLAAIAK